jgi:hypothetical protein
MRYRGDLCLYHRRLNQAMCFSARTRARGGPKDARSCIAGDILVAGWLMEEQGAPRVNGGIEGNLGDGFGVEDIVYGELRLDIGFLEAMYGSRGLSTNIRNAMLHGNPSTGAATIAAADLSVVNSVTAPSDGFYPNPSLHIELNCWHELERAGFFGRRQRAIALGPHPRGWVHQWWHPDYPDCWWPFPPFNPDDGPGDLMQGDYVLIRGAFWQDTSHGASAWDNGATKGHGGWLEIHPVDSMCRLPPPGLVKTAAAHSWAGPARDEVGELWPTSESAAPLRVAAHETVVDSRFTMLSTRAGETATDFGDHVAIESSLRPVGGQPVRYKAAHIVTWTLPAPAVCSTNPKTDYLEVVARGRDDACWLRRLDPAAGGWQPWESLGGVLTADPAVVAVPGALMVVARKTDDALYWAWYESPSGHRSGWQRIDDGVTLGRPAVCSTNPKADYLEVVARGRDDACWLRRLDPAAGGWQPWESLGGVLTADPAVVAVPGALMVVVRGTDGALYWAWYESPSGQRSGWQLVPNAVPGEPPVPLTGRTV